MSNTNEKSRGEPISDAVYKNLEVLETIKARMLDAYQGLLVMGEAGISSKFDEVVLQAAEQFTPEQKFALKQYANPKALREWNEVGANSYEPEDITKFLRRCFTDTCGHILSYSILPPTRSGKSSEVTDVMAMRSLEKACLINSGLDNIATNFQLMLGDNVNQYTELKMLLTTFKNAVRETNDGIDDLAESLHCDSAMVASIARQTASENLNRTTSISYLQHLEPSLWK